MNDALLNHLSNDRINSRQVDELIGLARGLIADDVLNLAEIEFLQTWLAANLAACHHPLMATLYNRIGACLADGVLDEDEKADLFSTLKSLTGEKVELGEILTSSTLPLCEPRPNIVHTGMRFCFTGTFKFGQRKDCEGAAARLGAVPGSLTAKTNFLVIGAYATESWKHSSFGNKILKAVDFRSNGHPISIISEEHWTAHLS